MKSVVTLKVIAALAASLMLGTIVAGAPATAKSAAVMLTESEPNDTAPEADGPIPAAGYIATRATPDDHDKFILRLKPQRQVTMTLRRVSGCLESANVNPTTFSLDRSDGKRQVGFSNWSGGTGVLTRSWTTPVIPIEYIGDISGDSWWEGHQCTVSVVVTPADAVIEGPLPALPARVASLAPVDAVVKRDFTAVVTGNAYTGDTLYTWLDYAGSTCTDDPWDEVESVLAAGPFNVPVTLSAGDVGPATVCTSLRNPDSGLIPDTANANPIAVRSVNALKVKSRKVRLNSKRRARIAVACLLPSGEVCTSSLTIRTKSGKVVANPTVSLASGQTRKAKFRVSRRIARKLAKAGVLRLRVTGSVTRAGAGTKVPVKKAQVLLVPARK